MVESMIPESCHF